MANTNVKAAGNSYTAKKVSGSEAKLQKYGVFFVIPFLAIYCFFQLWPVIYTILLSFTDLKGFETHLHFTGLENYARLVKDTYFWKSVGNTFIMWGMNFAPQLGIALLFAIWFTDPRMHLRGKSAFRALFYLPNLLMAASVAVLFKSLFAYPNGPINQFLYSLGIQATVVRDDGTIVKEGIQFFRSPMTARAIVAFIQWWLWCGQTLIMLMAGITSISPSLYESAVVDGANQSQQTRYITLPLLRPMMIYILITSLIGGMQLFEIPFLLPTDMNGGPGNVMRTMVLYMYNIAFQGRSQYAYGAAIAMGVFIITMFFSMIIYLFMQDRSDLGRK
ncbi:MAG: sugar ABC transporter permease [Treponema sp.]|nr:sugar ABC transporter permease [Treponema sp.]